MRRAKRKFIMKILSCVVSTLLLYPYGYTNEVGKITYVEGRVDVLRPDTEMAAPLREDEVISIGDILRTKSNSKIEVTFKDSSILRLAENSRVEIKDYQLDEKDSRITATINLHRGKIRTVIEKMRHEADFNIHTPNAEGKITGSDIFAFYQAGNSGMLVAAGKLSVINIAHPQNSLIVPPGNSVLVPLGDLPKGPRLYFELEKKFHEQDTNPPLSIIRRGKVTIIKGAVTRISGEVRITTRGANIAHKATINEIIGEGDRIETGEDGMIEIKFDNGNAINLKPNTNLVIVRLVIDPKTEEYENLFEVSMGKVRARIENLKGGSSFKIKTPTAISGARGTIMYVEVLPNMTKAFFEGGGGFLASTISGETTDLDAGENAFANDAGMVSVPILTSAIERMGFSEEWDPGSGIEGYSEPEGTAGTYLYDPDTGVDTTGDTGTGTGAGEGADTGDTGGIGDEYLDDPPITETTPTDDTPVDDEPEPSSLSGNFGAEFGYHDTGDNQTDLSYGSITGLFEVSGDIWSSDQPFTLSGQCSAPEPPDENYNKLWGGDLSGTGSDGSAFLGIAGGINNSLEGILYAFYIRPDLNGGFLAGYLRSSDMSGDFDFNTGTFNATGNLSSHFGLHTDVTPAQLYDGSPFLEGNDFMGLVGGGNLSGNIDGDSKHIQDQNWGLWKIGSGGDFQSLPGDGWEADIGGTSVDEDTGEIDGYWLGTMSGNAWENGEFPAAAIGISLSDDTMGVFLGDVLGTYNQADLSWQTLGAGMYADAPLAFGASLQGDFGYYDTDIDDYTDSGSFSALLGDTELSWSGPTDFTLLGKFDNPENRSLWLTGDFFARHHS